MKKLVLLLSLGLLLMSCSTKKDILYFQDIEEINLKSVDEIYEHPHIQVNDILKIDISAANEKSLIPFQFDKALMGASTQARQIDLLKLEGYLVRENGTINYPGLGELKVTGYTTSELQKELESKLATYIIDPTVRVRLLNFKITIIGEVKNPGTYEITEETFSLPQALGTAGDLTIQGKREQVLLIRQVADKREQVVIDLTTSDWMNSEYYYLKPNDIVYVTPNSAKVKSAGVIGNLGTLLSVFSILLSTAIIIFR
ncbi:polysaccharide biosynthesis/export family protein [Mesonia sp. K7]|uniref:polysaccharide biosynthesis/export family protein n=1 Tax=Mesonia sp. K7 TaxID=2218606 RepID=UPI000DAA64D0|nr:polysaccharide biosynthesis/export family protein [Mesonia sp. K7]PZD77690.1 polysaccharide export protein [Mesonia sp. K7]